HFLRGYAQRYRKNISGFDAAAKQTLLEHPWPGHVRELDHAVERGLLLATPPCVRPSDLGLRPAVPGRAARPEDMNLDEVERPVMQRILARHEVNFSQAAKSLGLSSIAMYRRLQKSGLE